MAKRTRLFVLISAGILVVGLGTGLVASYMGGFQALGLFGRDGPDELAYVPADAQIVAFADVRGVVGSELHETLRQFGRGREAARFQAETGIDLERDVDRLVASMSHGEADGQPGRPLLLARGRFDQPRIEGLARQQGGTFEDYRGIRFLSHADANLGIAFVEPGLVILGSPASVRRALDVKAGESAGVRGDADLMRQVREMDGGHAWAVLRGGPTGMAADGSLPLPPGLGPMLPAFSGFTWFAARGQVNGRIRGTLRAEATDDESAQNLRDAIRGAVALGRMQAGQHPELADLINSLELGGQGRTVSLGFALPAAMLDSLHRMMPPAALPPAVEPPPGANRPSAPRPQTRPLAPSGGQRPGARRVASVLPHGSMRPDGNGPA